MLHRYFMCGFALKKEAVGRWGARGARRLYGTDAEAGLVGLPVPGSLFRMEAMPRNALHCPQCPTMPGNARNAPSLQCTSMLFAAGDHQSRSYDPCPAMVNIVPQRSAAPRSARQRPAAPRSDHAMIVGAPLVGAHNAGNACHCERCAAFPCNALHCPALSALFPLVHIASHCSAMPALSPLVHIASHCSAMPALSPNDRHCDHRVRCLAMRMP